MELIRRNRERAEQEATGNVRLVDGEAGEEPDERTERLRNELTYWWLNQASVEVEATVPKAVEYGGHGAAQDLIWIGREMADMMGRTVDDQEATELGIHFYLLGKLARWKAAITEGRPVSDDTLHDISVYTRMAQRNRAVGGWPFASDPK